MTGPAGSRPDHKETRYAAALDYLNRLNRFGVRPGLHRMEAMLAALGRPERRIPHLIQVGGTNGKGSVSAMLAAVLQVAGQETGLYTSPHLVDTTERIRLNGRDVSRAVLASAISRVRPHAETLAQSGDPPTAFEVLTASAYLVFSEAAVDWLVQEVGLGGPLDATNVIPDYEVGVITNVSLDHTEHLGATVAAIAAGEAGWLRAGRPLVTAATAEALAVLRQRARRLGVPLIRVMADGHDPDHRFAEAVVQVRIRAMDRNATRFDLTGALGTFENLAVPLLGPHQALNGGVAAAALLLIRDKAGVDEGALRLGLASTRWPGRLEIVRRRPPVLLDGAHNLDSLSTLLRALPVLFPGRPVTLVFGLMRDKTPAFSALCHRPAAPLIPRAFAVTPPAGIRALPAAETARHLCQCGIPARPETDLGAALAQATAAARQDRPAGVVLVCGSLYLVGEALRVVARRGHQAASGPPASGGAGPSPSPALPPRDRSDPHTSG